MNEEPIDDTAAAAAAEDTTAVPAGAEPDDDEPLACAEPVDVLEVDEPPSGTPPTQHGDWVDAAPDDPAFDNTDGDQGRGDL